MTDQNNNIIRTTPPTRGLSFRIWCISLFCCQHLDTPQNQNNEILFISNAALPANVPHPSPKSTNSSIHPIGFRVEYARIFRDMQCSNSILDEVVVVDEVRMARCCCCLSVIGWFPGWLNCCFVQLGWICNFCRVTWLNGKWYNSSSFATAIVDCLWCHYRVAIEWAFQQWPHCQWVNFVSSGHDFVLLYATWRSAGEGRHRRVWQVIGGVVGESLEMRDMERALASFVGLPLGFVLAAIM